MAVLNTFHFGFISMLPACLPLITEPAIPAIFNCLMDDYNIPKGVFIILLMYRRERQFNIISGETQPYATQNYRSSSNMDKIKRF